MHLHRTNSLGLVWEPRKQRKVIGSYIRIVARRKAANERHGLALSGARRMRLSQNQRHLPSKTRQTESLGPAKRWCVIDQRNLTRQAALSSLATINFSSCTLPKEKVAFRKAWGRGGTSMHKCKRALICARNYLRRNSATHRGATYLMCDWACILK